MLATTPPHVCLDDCLAERKTQTAECLSQCVLAACVHVTGAVDIRPRSLQSALTPGDWCGFQTSERALVNMGTG